MCNEHAGADGFLTTLDAFGQLIADLNGGVRQIWQHWDIYIVCGKAVGTLQGPLHDIDPATGKRFEIMSMDVHRVEDRRLKEFYHIEEGLTAIRLLAAQ